MLGVRQGPCSGKKKAGDRMGHDRSRPVCCRGGQGVDGMDQGREQRKEREQMQEACATEGGGKEEGGFRNRGEKAGRQRGSLK